MGDSTRVEVTVLLPAFNEEESIGRTIVKIRELYPDFEILVVDDGSTDKTMKIALEAGANVWPHPYNIGNGAAIKTGMRLARGDWIVMMDADGQHDPNDIADLLKYRNTFDMIVGARSSDSQTSKHRDIANRIYNWLASYVANFGILDLTSGFRAVKADTVKQFIYLLPNTFSYPSTLTLAYLKSGRSVKYVLINTFRRKGKSKIKLINDGSRFFLIILKIATIFSPMRIFVPVSLTFGSSGILYYLYTYIKRHNVHMHFWSICDHSLRKSQQLMNLYIICT